jgi:hypothetical protein
MLVKPSYYRLLSFSFHLHHSNFNPVSLIQVIQTTTNLVVTGEDSEVGQNLVEECNFGDVIVNHFRSGQYQTKDIDGVPYMSYREDVRGHPSISLPILSSTTLPLFICTPHPHLCTISKEHTYNRWLPGPTIRRLSRSRLTDSRRLPTSPSARTSTASDGLRTHWDRSA